MPLGTSADIRSAGLPAANSQINRHSADSDPYRVKVHGQADSTTLYADLSTATAASINELRQAFLLQRFMEMRNWTGSDHEEMLKADFGVTPRDMRIGNPEYLGGGKETVQFSEVLDQGSSAAAVGDLKGHGVAAMRSNSYIKFFPEHGLVISLLCVKPIPVYHQGLRKMWSKDAKEDFYNPILEGQGS